MTDFIIKSAISMAVLLAVYHLFLEREKMHRFNRFYLLGALAVSLLLPFVTIPVYIPVAAEPIPELLPHATMVPEDEAIPQHDVNYWPYAVWGLYSLAALLLAFRFIKNIMVFYRLKKRGNTVIHLSCCFVPKPSPRKLNYRKLTRKKLKKLKSRMSLRLN